jgi:hypothetical protein
MSLNLTFTHPVIGQNQDEGVCIRIGRMGVHIPVYRARALWAIACQVIHEPPPPCILQHP